MADNFKTLVSTFYVRFIISAMSTPTRKRSLSVPSGSVKNKKYNCKFQTDWMKDFQFLRPSSLGNEFSFCTLCSVKKFKLNIGQNWQMTLYAHLFVPNKIKIWNVMSIVLTQRY